MPIELKWLILCAALAAGEAAGFAAADFAVLFPAAFACAAAALLFGFGLKLRLWPVVTVFSLGLALAWRTADRASRTLETILEANAARPVTAVFTVGDDVGERTRAGGIRRITFNGRIDDIRVRVILSGEAAAVPPRPGEVWRCTGWLGRTGEGPFGRRRPLWVSGRGSSAVRLAGPSGFSARLRAVRAGLSRRLALGLPDDGEAVDLTRAMLLGERHRLTPEAREAFVAAGTIHIFAISGLHVLFLAHLFAGALQLLRLPRRGISPVLIPAIWLYVLVTGASPSAVRAATMASLYYLAPVFWRQPNAFTAWSVAFIFAYASNPANLFDIGCNLSFTVMLALVLWSWWRRPFRLSRPVETLAVSTLAWAAAAPLAAHIFGRVTPGGLIANLVAAPLAFVTLTAATASLATGFLCEPLAAHFNALACLSSGALARLSRLIGAREFSSFKVRPWTLSECLLWYVALATALLLLRAALTRPRRI